LVRKQGGPFQGQLAEMFDRKSGVNNCSEYDTFRNLLFEMFISWYITNNNSHINTNEHRVKYDMVDTRTARDFEHVPQNQQKKRCLLCSWGIVTITT